MNTLAVVLLLTQTSIWTVSPPLASVGDTVRITRRLSAEPGARARAIPLDETVTYTPLSAPIVAYYDGQIVVRYQLAFFYTGDLAVPLPDIEISYPDGRIDFFHGDTALVRVGSVLPTDDSLPQPQPSVGPISRVQRSLIPMVSVVAAIVAMLTAWVVRRRRILPRPVWSGSDHQDVDVPLQQWMKAGEPKAVIAAVSDRLRDSIESVLPAARRPLNTREVIEIIEKNRPDWPRREIEDVLRSLDRALYAPAVPSDLALLVEQVDDLVALVRDDSATESGE